jgi:Sulfatase
MRSSTAGQFLLPAAVSFGVSTIVFLDYFCLLSSPTHLFIYHFDEPASTVFIPVILDTFLLALICLATLLVAQTRPRLNRIVWSVMGCMLPWVFIKAITAACNIEFPHRLSLVIFGLSAIALVTFLFVRTPTVDRAFSALRFFAESFLAAIGIVGAIPILQAGWLGFEARHLNDQIVSNTVRVQSAARPHQRVVWILLDELAYRQLYGHRLPGLQLPAFDRFHNESTVFSDVQPAGIHTEIVLPELMTGHPVDDIRASPQGRLLVHNQSGWQPFNQRDTVFADADSLGYVTSVVGWYNPYCRLLPAVLNSCFWTYSFREDLLPTQTFAQDLMNPFVNLTVKIPGFFHPSKNALYEYIMGKEHIRDFTSLQQAADAALSDPRNTFVFLHMPVPHPNGIWDRRTGRFAIDHSAYVDNLALADLYLAHVRQLLTSIGQWDDTTIVIEGDHSWRTRQLWLNSPAWSSDDAAASDGGSFDPRPALIVKLPNQHISAQIDTSFAATRTRPLLDELLERRITNPNQLEHWACCETQGASAMQPAHGHFSPPT